MEAQNITSDAAAEATDWSLFWTCVSLSPHAAKANMVANASNFERTAIVLILYILINKVFKNDDKSIFNVFQRDIQKILSLKK